MTIPALGEFLHPAAGHLVAAVSAPDDVPDDARDTVTWELGRVVAALARYLRDLPLPDEFDPALNPALKPGGPGRGRGPSGTAMGRRQPAPRPRPAWGGIRPGDPHPVAGHLAALRLISWPQDGTC